MGKLYERMKPFIAVIFLQLGFAGMDILSKLALNEGMSNYVFVVYRHAIAAIVIIPLAIILDRKTRPKMTFSIFAKIMLLSLLEPVIDQNLYFLGMKYTTATFATAMSNMLPAITFVMAWALGMEKLKINSNHSKAKVIGTVATVGGAMFMTVVKGPVVELFRAKGSSTPELQRAGLTLKHSIMGSLMITVGCFAWAAFMNLQAITLRTYPAELSLTAWICMLGTAQGAVVALIMERGKASVWSINWDAKFLAAAYSGIFCSGFAYYIQGVIMKDRGPVFVTAFSPLCMVIVAVMSSFILAEQMTLGRVMGAMIIVAGLYLVIWGKSKDYKSESLITDKQTTQAMQLTDGGNNGDLVPCHNIITINASNEGAMTVQEQKHDKGNQIKPSS